MDSVRISKAQHAAKGATKEARLKRKHDKLVQDDKIARKEGPMYGPGIASLPGENQTQKTASKRHKKAAKKK